MDYQPQPSFYMNKRSTGFATASLVLGIVSLATFACIYLAIPCAALGIIFALLSRGGEKTMAGNAKIGLILSIIAFITTIIVFIGMMLYTVYLYGGWDAFYQYVYQFTENYMNGQTAIY